jgi:hypothetical protein
MTIMDKPRVYLLSEDCDKPTVPRSCSRCGEERVLPAWRQAWVCWCTPKGVVNYAPVDESTSSERRRVYLRDDSGTVGGTGGVVSKRGDEEGKADTLKKWLSTYRAARASSPGLSCLRGKVNKGTLREALRQAQLYSASLEII